MSINSKICIMVDSSSDMLPDEAKKLGITLIPLKVRFDDEEFDDGVNITRDEFYNRLVESDTIPKTSLVSPQRYAEYFENAVSQGYEVVCLVLSSNISGSYQSAVIAAEEFEGKVHVVDTMQFCGPEYLLAIRAVQLRSQGADAAEIVATINEEKKHTKIVALFDTLEYLKLGGRISSTAAFAGNLLSLKPVITIENGAVSVIGKARGSKNGNNHLVKFVQNCGGIDWTMPVVLSWSGTNDELLKKYLEDSKCLYEGHSINEMTISRVGSTIGTYTGPGAIALSFYPKNR